jgi:hypothetical protein
MRTGFDDNKMSTFFWSILLTVLINIYTLKFCGQIILDLKLVSSVRFGQFVDLLFIFLIPRGFGPKCTYFWTK